MDNRQILFVKTSVKERLPEIRGGMAGTGKYHQSADSGVQPVDCVDRRCLVPELAAQKTGHTARFVSGKHAPGLYGDDDLII